MSNVRHMGDENLKRKYQSYDPVPNNFTHEKCGLYLQSDSKLKALY